VSHGFGAALVTVQESHVPKSVVRRARKIMDQFKKVKIKIAQML